MDRVARRSGKAVSGLPRAARLQDRQTRELRLRESLPELPRIAERPERLRLQYPSRKSRPISIRSVRVSLRISVPKLWEFHRSVQKASLVLYCHPSAQLSAASAACG